LPKYFISWGISRKFSIWILPGTTGSFWVQSLQSFFLFCLIWDFKTSGNFQKYFMSWKITRESYLWITFGTTGSFWVQSLQTFFVLYYLGLYLIEKSAESPQSIYSLAQLARLLDTRRVYPFKKYGNFSNLTQRQEVHWLTNDKTKSSKRCNAGVMRGSSIRRKSLKNMVFHAKRITYHCPIAF
jgi:hypothetical protein